MSTIYEVAKVAGVSAATVSKVINNYPDVSDKTRKKIKKILEDMKFRPNSDAQSLATKKTWTLGIIYFEDSNIGLKHPFFSAVIESFKRQSEKHGYSLLFGSKNNRLKNKTFLEYFRYKKVDGIAVICSNPYEEEVLELIESEFPVVFIDFHHNNASTVTSNNYEGCKMAVEYLYNLGHRKIAHITGMKQDNNYISNLREQAYVDEMKKLNLDIKEGYIQKGNNFDFQGGYDAMLELLKLKDRPTAVFAASDKTAFGAIEAVKSMNLRVPEDISIIGFDDIEACLYTTPKLTTIRQNCDEIGKKAADILVDEIDGDIKESISSIIPVQLIVRESCGKIWWNGFIFHNNRYIDRNKLIF